MNNVFLKNEISKYSIISFDVFDTLIKRNVKKPTDIFYIIQNRFNNKNPDNQIFDFYTKRKKAEEKARSNSKSEDIRFDNIYEFIDYPKKIKQKLKIIEIDVEMDYCVKNEEMYEIYRFLIENNRKIICISDMYFSKNIIEQILKKNGYNIESIFISSEYGLTKRSGNLFKKVLQILNAKTSEIVHIGDNKNGDYKAPRKLGIRAVKIKRTINNIKNYNKNEFAQADLSKNIIISLINNNIVNQNGYYRKMGYEIVGPIVFYFTKWLYSIAKDNKIESLLFCARDMKMIQSVFNDYYGEEIRNTYFYVSRKSSYLPYLFKNNSFDKICELLPKGKRKYTIRECMDSFNISLNHNYIYKNNKLDIDKPYYFDEIKKLKQFNILYDTYIKKYIEKYGSQQYNFFMKYIKSYIVKNKTALVDLGWRGTTQTILMNILKQNITGFYFGLYEKNGQIYDNYYTFLFDEDKGYYMKIHAFQTLFEAIFSALHGTTLRYKDSGEEPYVLDKSVNKDNELINELQNGACDFCKDVKKYKEDIIDFEQDYFVNKLFRVCLAPNLTDARMLGGIYTDNITTRKLVDYKGMKYYIRNFKELRNDFKDSEWKIGFLKQLVKIKLPYYKIYLINK